jgi:hypothetical protein
LEHVDVSKHNSEADDESVIVTCSRITALGRPGYCVESARPNFPGLIHATRTFMILADNWFGTISTTETWSNKRSKKKRDGLGQ